MKAITIFSFGASSLCNEAIQEIVACRPHTLSSEQPGPVALGLRPGSPYRFLDIVELASAATAKRVVDQLGQARRARKEARSYAIWAFAPLMTVLHADKPPAGSAHVHLAFTNPGEGREDEYNHWYGGEHLAHAFLAEGFQTAQRLRLVAEDAQGDVSAYQYLTVYGLRTDDIRAAEDDMHAFATGEKPGMDLPKGLIGPARATWVYSPSS